MNTLIKIALLAVTLIACDEGFAPGSRVESPRILALQADRPYARPGDDVELTLLSANPGGESLQWAWGTCTLPQSSTVEACFEALDGELMPFEPSASALQLQIPSDVLDDLSPGEQKSALIGVVVVACPGELLAAGNTLHVPTRCLDSRGRARPIHDIEVGVKRVFVRERDRNRNPAITEVTWDGEAWDEDEIQRAQLCEKDTVSIEDCAEALQHRIHVRAGEAETGSDQFGTEFAEQVIVQFYATHGLFRDQLRLASDADNRWVPQPSPVDEGHDIATLWIVARDDRGGVSWTTRQVELRQ